MSYIGRFAPSPTGPMHFGTLIAAVASYCQAKANVGSWLVRMEDVDLLRKVEGADTQILLTLEAFGFEWQGEVVYQSTRTVAYEEALQYLQQLDLVFPCTCSRKQLARDTGEWSPVYPGTCRDKTDWSIDEYAIRMKTTNETDDSVISFEDKIFGRQQQNISRDVGDFIIKRRDGLFAYQLAVVVDDAWQGITEVVRGTDLIDSTARQIFLQRHLGYDTPDYLHFPVAVDQTGNKLSKSSRAIAVENKYPLTALNAAMKFLGQRTIDADNVEDFWKLAVLDWDVDAISKREAIALDT